MTYFKACQEVQHAWTHPKVEMHRTGQHLDVTLSDRMVTEDVWTEFCAEDNTEKGARAALDKIIKSVGGLKWAYQVEVSKHRTWKEILSDVALGIGPMAP